MSTRGRFDKEVNQIESIAETKGIELDDIEVRETETDDGDELVVFRILETKGETEEDSVGVQVSKMPSVQTGDMTFRNDIQNKLNALKRHLAGEQPSEQIEDEEVAQDSDDSESSQSRSSRSSRTRTRDDYDGGPGAELDQRLMEVEDRLDELEARVEELEDKSEALDGLQKLVGESSSDDEGD